jgi:TetR/AcrR family transcriptional regulator, repressor for uid operon
VPKVIREYKAQARERIVDAAMEVFRRKGLSGGTMEEIAREIGVSKGALYLYFPTKTRLLEAIQARFRDEMLDRFNRVAEKGDVAEAIAGAMDKVVSGEFDPSVGVELISLASSDPEIRQALRKDDADDCQVMLEFLQGLEARGRIPPMRDAVATADIVMLLLQGSFIRVALQGRNDEIKQRLIRSLRAALGLPPRRAYSRGISDRATRTDPARSIPSEGRADSPRAA